MKVFVLLLALILVPACSDDSPTAPTATFGTLTGTWAGAVSDPANGSGTMRIELTELTIDAARSLIGGTWAATFADPTKNAAGNVGGILSTGQMAITATPTAPPSCTPAPLVPAGTLAITATVAANEITGTYTFGTCSGSVPGTIALRRP